LRGGGGVFQEKTGGNAVNLTNLHRVDTKSRRNSPFPLLFCWILMKSNKKRLNFLHSQRKSKRFACLQSFLHKSHVIRRKSKIFFKYYAAS